MSVRALTWALDQQFSYEETALKLLLVSLADFANDKHQCWPSQTLLCEILGGCSLDTVQRLLKRLEDREKIVRQRRYGEGGRRTTDLIILKVDLNRKRAAKTKPQARGLDHAAPRCGPAMPQHGAVTRTTNREPSDSQPGKVLGESLEEDTRTRDDEVPA